MRYGFIDAKRGDSLALPTRDSGQARKRFMIGLVALALLWIAL
jgi:hypothetical protein